jgi:uncharacterized membrane protein
LPDSFSIEEWLVVSCGFSVALLFIKIILSGHLTHVFLAWNLFLAFVPFFISRWMTAHQRALKSKIKLVALVFFWIIFMPNSFYIVTDLFHLNNFDNKHSWFDLTLILSFSWNGILFGVLSIQKMEMLLKKRLDKSISFLALCAVMWLNAFGIYIGRYLRFNSWDIFINPFSFLSEIGNLIFNPYDYKYAWVMSVCFAGFIIIIYYTVKKLNDASKNG